MPSRCDARRWRTGREGPIITTREGWGHGSATTTVSGRPSADGQQPGQTRLRLGGRGVVGQLDLDHLVAARRTRHQGDRPTCLLYTSDAADDLLCVDLG